ncbi:hypothetical protein MCP_1158 [Methanocella paludicola SANAE]|uniref:Uncharacterized protein n=1 Tax=Methanocella paludicola (strain DSM 17711 / JCM 13418 / NBRC 101707 / SANAE) TaxID=304371 RepID=D1YXQ8_METPS|nr:hypothetical protein MCP_1158 [Methanocella paludicola SANAE]
MIGLSRENMAIRYAALVMAIVLIGSVLVVGLATAKAPVSGTDKVMQKAKNTPAVTKNPNPSIKAIMSDLTTRAKAAIKSTPKPTIKPTMPKKMVAIKPTVYPTVKTKAAVKPTVKPTIKPTTVKSKP